MHETHATLWNWRRDSCPPDLRAWAISVKGRESGPHHRREGARQIIHVVLASPRPQHHPPCAFSLRQEQPVTLWTTVLSVWRRVSLCGAQGYSLRTMNETSVPRRTIRLRFSSASRGRDMRNQRLCCTCDVDIAMLPFFLEPRAVRHCDGRALGQQDDLLWTAHNDACWESVLYTVHHCARQHW